MKRQIQRESQKVTFRQKDKIYTKGKKGDRKKEKYRGKEGRDREIYLKAKEKKSNRE